MLHETRVVRQDRQDPWRFLSIPFVALVLLSALLVTILLVALVVGSSVGPHLAHAAAFAQSPSFASIVRPLVECPNGIPTC